MGIKPKSEAQDRFDEDWDYPEAGKNDWRSG
jgi:hypothetical protein